MSSSLTRRAGLSAPSASSQKTSSAVVQMTYLRDRMPFQRGQMDSGEPYHARCGIWVRTTLSVKTSLGLKGLRTALRKRTWGCWWMEIGQKDKRTVGSRSMEVNLLLFAALLRHLYCIQLWVLQLRKEVDLLEWFHSYEKSVRWLGLINLEKTPWRPHYCLAVHKGSL